MLEAAAIITAIDGVIKLATATAQAGKDAAPFAKMIYDTFVGGKEVTQADVDALHARATALYNEIDAPLPEDGATA